MGARLLGAPRTYYSRSLSSCLSPPVTARPSRPTQAPASRRGPRSLELEINPQQGCPARYPWRVRRWSRPGQSYPVSHRHHRHQPAPKAEDDLRRSEEKFRLLFDNAPLGYQSLDEDGIIREVNQAWLDILGYSGQEVIGRWFGDFLPPDHFKLLPESIACLKGTGEVCNVDFEMVRKDGTRITVSFNGGSRLTTRAGLSGPTACSRM